MWKSTKSKLAVLLTVAGCAISSLAQASIIVDHSYARIAPGRSSMSTIVMVPMTESQASALYQLERAHAWGNYRRSKGAVGYSSVSGLYAPNLVAATTPRQVNLRMNMARARGFGHGYFNNR